MIFETCTLSEEERTQRGHRIAALRARAIEDNDTSDSLRLVFLRDPDLAAELAELAAREAECCGVVARLDIGPDTVSVELTR